MDRATLAQTVERAPSKSQVNKAGQVLRRWLRGDLDPTDPNFRTRIVEAVAVIQEYRAAHQYSLSKATMGLRSVVNTERCSGQVSQRLKRLDTIFNKLRREPTMALANMQDIGGCRAVLDTIEEVRRVERRLKNRDPVSYYDYIANPRPSGYRGVHVVVAYEDPEGDSRLVEVQLRTRTMHEWAITVERLSGQIKHDLKSGMGPPEVVELLGVVSEAMALEEVGKVVPQDMLDRMVGLRQAAVGYLPKA